MIMSFKNKGTFLSISFLKPSSYIDKKVFFYLNFKTTCGDKRRHPKRNKKKAEDGKALKENLDQQRRG